MDLKEALLASRARIEQGWTQGANARNSSGEEVAFSHKNAVSWCLVGCTPLAYHHLSYEVRKALHKAAGTSNLANWNDYPGRKKEDVLNLFDRALVSLDISTEIV